MMAAKLTLERLDRVLDRLATIILEHENGDAFVGMYAAVEKERELMSSQDRIKARIADRQREVQFS